MENEIIILPCGYSAKYKDVFYSIAKFPCPVCIKHDITRQECLNMTKNKMLINEINLNLKRNQYEELMKEFENCKNLPKHYIDESYDCVKREVDLRREEIKALLNKKIDDYHDGLLKKIDMERDIKLKDVEEKIKQAEAFDLNSLNVDTNLDVYSKLDFYEKNNIKIDIGIGLIKNILEDFKEPKLKLTDSTDNINFSELFGELYSVEETSIILDKDEFDYDSRTEATIKLKINSFSQLKDKKNLRICSKKCIVQNFEWYIMIRLNEEDGKMGFFLHCNSKGESNKFPVNTNVVLSLLNKSDSKKDLSRKYERLFTQIKQSWGYPDFTTINEIMNPTKAYYDANEDLVTLKATVKAELPQKIF
ncbi:ubiquitin carboxyl-terminal hydrolase 7 isoform X1 [Brachionus plicatilis]|uniref:Ubiquitin carboxyl-terminal hydrolase 7 isoform X1 n=1 Tax=Brachionus plicatilis TaxID=10195 RepID=A0A3M7SUJ7_BRAPC|nr:ubiquitin carboxyl-terminal hydrolase 7 isoform X1 [Brachionus plicatilis]